MLARALVGDPDILIADEPISGLDPKHALDTLARLRALTRAGKLVIISIHDLTLAARYATRLVVIHRKEFYEIIKREPALATKMLWSFVQVLAERLRVLEHRERRRHGRHERRRRPRRRTPARARRDPPSPDLRSRRPAQLPAALLL